MNTDQLIAKLDELIAATRNGQKTFDDCDDSELCPILAASFRGTAKEWIEHDDAVFCCPSLGLS